MKKIILTCAITILLLSLSIFIHLNIKINISINGNKIVIEQFNNIFKTSNLEYSNEEIKNIPKLELNSTDYIGSINIEEYGLILPVQNICNNNILDTTSACNYTSTTFTILGTNLKNSFNSYKSYNLNDKVIFTNALGEKYLYKIEKIKRVEEINEISQYNDASLIIVVKNYYDMNYVLFICDTY